VTCTWCGRDVPEGRFCGRCGARQDASQEHAPAQSDRRAARGAQFAAAPHERVASPRLVSTLFPHLPADHMATFRLALLGGTATIVVLAALRLFPVALVAAAVLVPLTTITYLIAVDLYESEPIRVLAATMAWGVLAGVGLGFAGRALAPSGVELLIAGTGSRILARGVALPLAGLVLASAGPLLLLRYRWFNDVLDGVTFGTASAVSLAGAQALVVGAGLFTAGVRPPGAVSAWIWRLLAQGVAVPVLWAAAVGLACGSFWLRYRAPVRDRSALGAIGQPATAVPVAAVLVVGASVAQLELRPLGALIALIPVDVAALLALRVAIHVGLLEEIQEVPAGAEITCPNCDARIARMSFCSNCGIALSALPKGAAPPSDATPAGLREEPPT
jgi:hypothetical protein